MATATDGGMRNTQTVPSEVLQSGKKQQNDYDFKVIVSPKKTIVSSFTNPHAAKTIGLSFFL